MMPKRAVAERATMTRLWARLRRRLSWCIVSVLRFHRGLRREGDAVAGRVSNHRDPWLEEEGDLHRDRVRRAGDLSDAGPVPDESSIGDGRNRRAAATGRYAGAQGIERQGEATAELALHRRDHGGRARQRTVVGDGGTRGLAGR